MRGGGGNIFLSVSSAGSADMRNRSRAAGVRFTRGARVRLRAAVFPFQELSFGGATGGYVEGSGSPEPPCA